MQKISIIGCGWLGLPLAKKLLSKNYIVSGSTTSKDKLNDLKKNNIDAYILNFPNNINTLKTLCETDILILTLPFKRSYTPPEIYYKQLKTILNYAENKQVKKILLTSSTSAYSNTNTNVHEDDKIIADNKRQQTLLESEQMILSASFCKSIVARLSGLYGPNREIGKFIQNKSNQNGNNKVNLIHQDDVVEILIKLIESNHWNEIYNIVSDNHPTKIELYTKKALEKKIKVPLFDNDAPLSFKIVSNKKIKKLLNYTFKYPNPLE